MSKLLKLTLFEVEETVYIQSSAIVSMQLRFKAKDHVRTYIRLLSGISFEIIESPEIILKMIEESNG